MARATAKLPDPRKARKYFEDKLAFTTGPVELKELLDEGKPPNIIDVRSSEDYEEAHVPGALNIPEEQWRTAKGLSKKKLNVIYCYSQTCHLAARAAVFFAGKGFPVMELEGGFEAWKEAEFPVETRKPPEARPEPRAA